MNKNTIVSIFVIIVVIILGIVFWQYSKKNTQEAQTPTQELDSQTRADSTTSIYSNLNSIDTDSSSDFNEVDGEVNSY